MIVSIDQYLNFFRANAPHGNFLTISKYNHTMWLARIKVCSVLRETNCQKDFNGRFSVRYSWPRRKISFIFFEYKGRSNHELLRLYSFDRLLKNNTYRQVFITDDIENVNGFVTDNRVINILDKVKWTDMSQRRQNGYNG